MTDGSIRPVLIVKDGMVYANSRDVAAYFDKQHKDVLRAIDNLLARGAQMRRVSFQEVSSPHPTIKGTMIRSFDMDRDAFTLLVMGFTGEAAFAFKMAYIIRFKEMEEEIKKPVLPPPPQAISLEHVMAAITGLTQAVTGLVQAQISSAPPIPEIEPPKRVEAPKPRAHRVETRGINRGSRGKPPSYSREDIALILALAAKGSTDRDIAAIVRLHVNTVAKARRFPDECYAILDKWNR